jgi:Tfp pilus assembly protein PilZ
MHERKEKRIALQLYAKLNSQSLISWGILCDVSNNGLFIKSNQDFTVGEVIDIEIFMPDNTSSFLNGIVRIKIELLDTYRKNGFGIELTEKGMSYRNFLQSLMGRTKKHAGTFV